MKLLDLFAGIGGLSLAAEWAGIRLAGFCEIDPFCQQVLKKHWPDVPCWPDVTTLTVSDLTEEVDIIAGGFPCQDISAARTPHGDIAGLAGARSGLWSEFARLVGEVQPRWVVVENVANVRRFGLETVLHDLAALGFDADWAIVPASAVGAPHKRARCFMVAWQAATQDADGAGLEGGISSLLARAFDGRYDPHAPRPNWGSTTPRLRGRTDGVPRWVDRLRALGNAVVPQVAFPIFSEIMAQEGFC